jgi:hypothetical protein
MNWQKFKEGLFKNLSGLVVQFHITTHLIIGRIKPKSNMLSQDSSSIQHNFVC